MPSQLCSTRFGHQGLALHLKTGLAQYEDFQHFRAMKHLVWAG